MSFFYLGSPYSLYRPGRNAAFELACREAGRYIAADVPVFSPIIYSHSVAALCDLDPLDAPFWTRACFPLMNAACGMIALTADGWRESVGMRQEIEHFERRGKPVVYAAPGAELEYGLLAELRAVIARAE